MANIKSPKDAIAVEYVDYDKDTFCYKDGKTYTREFLAQHWDLIIESGLETAESLLLARKSRKDAQQAAERQKVQQEQMKNFRLGYEGNFNQNFGQALGQAYGQDFGQYAANYYNSIKNDINAPVLGVAQNNIAAGQIGVWQIQPNTTVPNDSLTDRLKELQDAYKKMGPGKITVAESKLYPGQVITYPDPLSIEKEVTIMANGTILTTLTSTQTTIKSLLKRGWSERDITILFVARSANGTELSVIESVENDIEVVRMWQANATATNATP